MSFILEALRKSEAERRRGQAPQLFDAAPPPPALPPVARAHWRWALPTVAALALALLWWPGDRSDETAAARVPPATSWIGDGTLPDPATVAAHDAAPAAADEPSATPVIAPAPVDAATPAAAVTRRDGPDTAFQRTPSEAAAAVTPIAPVPSSPPARVAATPGPEIARVANPSAATARAAAPPAPETVPVAPPPTTTLDTPLRLADLSAADRSALPPLRMSMHLWAPAPADRFVILDGNRVGEGDRVGNTVVEQIAPDGVVLAWQGRRLKVPVR